MTKRSALLSAAFLLAAAVLLLLFVGIHNAWDNVTFFVKRQRLAASETKAGTGQD